MYAVATVGDAFCPGVLPVHSRRENVGRKRDDKVNGPFVGQRTYCRCWYVVTKGEADGAGAGPPAAPQGA
eukprot:1906428-Lingulodinium_polyedra.AAC.1